MANHVYTSAFGLCPTYAEVLDRGCGWGLDHCRDGIVLTAHRVQVTVCLTNAGKRFVLFLGVVVAVRAVSTMCGMCLGRAAEPLELITWLGLARKYMA
jgi:hypothetical protein